MYLPRSVLSVIPPYCFLSIDSTSRPKSWMICSRLWQTFHCSWHHVRTPSLFDWRCGVRLYGYHLTLCFFLVSFSLLVYLGFISPSQIRLIDSQNKHPNLNPQSSSYRNRITLASNSSLIPPWSNSNWKNQILSISFGRWAQSPYPLNRPLRLISFRSYSSTPSEIYERCGAKPSQAILFPQNVESDHRGSTLFWLQSWDRLFRFVGKTPLVVINVTDRSCYQGSVFWQGSWRDQSSVKLSIYRIIPCEYAWQK